MFSRVRGVAKRLLKGYFLVADRVQERAVEPHETLQVLVAETRTEGVPVTPATAPATAGSAGARARAKSPSRKTKRAP